MYTFYSLAGQSQAWLDSEHRYYPLRINRRKAEHRIFQAIL